MKVSVDASSLYRVLMALYSGSTEKKDDPVNTLVLEYRDQVEDGSIFESQKAVVSVPALEGLFSLIEQKGFTSLREDYPVNVLKRSFAQSMASIS